MNHCHRQKVSITVEDGQSSTNKRKGVEDDDEEDDDEEDENENENKTKKIKGQELEEGEPEDGIKCPKCPKVFLSQQLFHQHISRHERKNGCLECDYVGAYPSNLKAHIMYKHSKERNFACKLCFVKFKTNNDLVRHVYLHSNQGQTENVCDICSKSFQTPYSLKRHRAEHSQETEEAEVEEEQAPIFMFQCEVCQEKFEDLETITEHLKMEHSTPIH